jgi:hypothetical protein
MTVLLLTNMAKKHNGYGSMAMVLSQEQEVWVKFQHNLIFFYFGALRMGRIG